MVRFLESVVVRLKYESVVDVFFWVLFFVDVGFVWYYRLLVGLGFWFDVDCCY